MCASANTRVAIAQRKFVDGSAEILSSLERMTAYALMAIPSAALRLYFRRHTDYERCHYSTLVDFEIT